MELLPQASEPSNVFFGTLVPLLQLSPADAAVAAAVTMKHLLLL